ncbi:MAG: chemotaxis protein CheX [Candidatus Saccharibacteria bacterium]
MSSSDLLNPFLNAMLSVMPQLGFQQVTTGKLTIKADAVSSMGVTLIVGMSHQVRGNVAYNMSEATAKEIASVMMMGMQVDEFGELAQSALAELANMITASAAVNFEKQEKIVDISPPSLVIGENFTARLSTNKFICLETYVDSKLIELNISLET